nr:MAG TPA: large terminase [Caudoviricetes sp.]
MILFRSDFYKQKAIIDVNTRNVHFLRMANLLQKMEVKNNMFFLALTQPELAKYDPHNLTDDSTELKLRIAYECKINPWYYIREVLRVGASGAGGIPYILNRANLAQAWCAFNSIDSFLTMPRQIGKTIGSIGLTSWVIYCGAKNISFGMFAKGSKLQLDNVRRLKDMRDRLPPWMVTKQFEDKDNKEGIYYSALNNEYLTFVAKPDKRAAEDQARGNSLAWEHWDEVVYYDNIDLSFPTATSAMDTARPQCVESGCPAAVLLTSTAGDIDDPRGRFAFTMVRNAMRFHEKIYDCEDIDEVRAILRDQTDNDMFYLEYAYWQLGKDRDWFNDKTRNKDPKKIAKDYLNQWLHGSGGAIFPEDLINRMVASIREPVTVTRYETLCIRWYQDPAQIMSEPYRSKPYIMGSDTSNNTGRDFTTFIMIDPYDLAPVATFRCNTSNTAFITQCIKKFLLDFPKSVFIPERQGNGAVILDFIMAMMQNVPGFDPFSRIYNAYCQDYNSSTPDFRKLDLHSGLVRKHFGFNTGQNSREKLYSAVLTTAMELNADRLLDATLVMETKMLTTRNGRIDHVEGGHDDLLIAYLLCIWFVLYGRNHHMYGIMPGVLMQRITDTGKETDKATKERLARLRTRGKELKKLIDHTENSIIKGAYMRELQNITDLLGDDGFGEEETNVRSIDQVLSNNREAKKASPKDILRLIAAIH